MESLNLELECCKCGSNCSAHNTVGFVGRGRWVPSEIDESEGETPGIEMNNVKFLRAICEECFMQDNDLCRFFNKLGMQTR